MVDIQGPVAFGKGSFQIYHGRTRGNNSNGYSPQRILALSRPKESRQIWLTSCGANLNWGQQDLMWPIPAATLKRQPSQRLVELTKPKRNFQLKTLKENRPEFVYSCGRNSQIWDIKNGALLARASKRLAELAKPKYPPPDYCEHRHQHQYSCGRESPIWTVLDRARSCKIRPRTAELAKPKKLHPRYTPNSEVPTAIDPLALKAYCSDRVSELAKAKLRNEGLYIDSRLPEDAIRTVSANARAASASPRLIEIAKCKGFADGYLPNRTVHWPVSRATRRAIATPRQEQLATPIIRATMDHVQFNPDAFLVKEAAKKARCTKRLEELAQPIQR